MKPQYNFALMPLLLILIGAVLFVLGAIVSYFSGIRSLQTSRRLADYRVRQRYLVRARWSLLFGLLSVMVAVFLIFLNRPTQQPAIPLASAVPVTDIAPSLALAPINPGSNTGTTSPTVTETSLPPAATATFFVITPSPAATATGASTSTPFLPIAVQAMVQDTMTPVFPVEIGRLRFSTGINNYQLIAPGISFHNPIKHMYAVFNYQPLGVKIQWTALWFQGGSLRHIDTTSWKNAPAGIGVADWAQEPQAWLAGKYEVQIFLGTGWKASGTFSLEGEPPTITPT